MKNLKKRILALLMSVGVLLNLVPMAFAADSSATETLSSNVQMVTIEEAGVSREEALKILGMSEEEVGEHDIYTFSYDVCGFTPTSKEYNSIEIPKDEYHIFPEFSFTTYLRGNTNWTLPNATMFMWGGTNYKYF